MFSDKKIIVIVVETIAIIILVILMANERFSAQDEEDAFLQQLKQQNKELEDQLTRVKLNYIEIGLADSIQTRSMDSLIAHSNQKIKNLREESQTYRDALEEMKTREWKRLSEAQKTKEIEEALNFLKSNEKSH